MGLIEKLKELAAKKQHDEIKNAAKDSAKFEMSITTSSIYVDSYLAEGCEISMLNLCGYVSPSGSYMNYAVFEVVGTNPETGRKNTRRYEAATEQQAIKTAEKDGLQNPEIKRAIPDAEPTENQVSYLESWNVSVPEGACKYDVSAILSRLEDSDDIVKEVRVSKDREKRYVRPVAGPSEEFAMFAHQIGVLFSKFIGAGALHASVVHFLKDRDKAAFFAYCVLCSHNGVEIGNMLEASGREKLYAFADVAAGSEPLMRSINSRDPEDYLHPHKGSAAYKAVAEYFGL